MKLTIPRTELLTALAAVKPVARGALPVLTNVLLVANERSITLTATDLDLHLRLRTDAIVARSGEATVRAALLFDLVRMADGEDVRIELEKHQLVVECGNARHRLTTIDTGEFPDFPRLGARAAKNDSGKSKVDNGRRSPASAPSSPMEFTLEDAMFRALLAETGFAASTDESRHVLCGSLVKVESGQLSVAACDGHRIAVSSLDCPVNARASLVLPGKTARELLRLLGGDIEKPQRLTIKADANLVLFSFGDITIASKLIEGNYPDYRKIIPAEDAIATLPRAELLRAIERIALVADDATLEFTKSALRLRSSGKRGSEIVGEASDSLLIPANQTTEATFKARHLCDTLNAITDEAVEFHLSASRVGMFKSPGRDWCGVIASVQSGKKPGRSGESVKPVPSQSKSSK